MTATSLAQLGGAIISVQFGGALAAILIPMIGAPATVMLRLVLSAGLMLLILRPSPRGNSPRAWRAVLMLGVTLGTMNFSFYQALARLPMGVAVTIEFLGPLLLSAAMSRRIRDGVAVVASLLGVVLISEALKVGWSGLDHVGLGFVALAGLAWAAYILCQAEMGRHFQGLDGVTWAILIAAVLVTPYGLFDAHGPVTTLPVLAGGLGIALLSSAIPYSLEMMALRTIPPQVFSILLALEPAVAALAGLIVLGQRLSATQLVGMGLVVAASVIVTWRPRR